MFLFNPMIVMLSFRKWMRCFLENPMIVNPSSIHALRVEQTVRMRTVLLHFCPTSLVVFGVIAELLRRTFK